MKNLLKNFLIFFFIFIVIAGLFYNISDVKQESEKIGIHQLIEEINTDKVESIAVEGDILKVTLKDGNAQTVQKETGESLSALLNNFSVSQEKIAGINIEVKDESGLSFWLSTLLPLFLPLLLIGFFIYFMIRQVQGANGRAMMFGQSQARETNSENQDKKKKVTFKEVAGVKEAKEELKEVVEFLTSPKKFLELGAKIPKGVLLVGPPGTGKTLLAKAVAGEANVPFYSISGSEFVEMFVGVGASRVRDLFKRAKKNAPCIVFIDEIDAVGRQRGAGLGGSHDEREQTLNQILVEMDGFEPNLNVIVIAATNRPDVLDPALLRPGRFDRRVVLDEPDLNDRIDILKVHAKNKPLQKEVSLRRIAQRTPGFSGADLANLLNEAAILSARRDKRLITMDELFESIEKVLLGPERKSRLISEKEKEITAYHEAGHALVSHIMPNANPVQKISIISRGMAGGYTLTVPLEDKRMHSKTEFLEELAVLLGGYVAEQVIFNEITTGASSDLRRATKIARYLITDYGMSEGLGPRTFGKKEEMIFLGREMHEQRDYSEKVAEKIDEEVTNYINKAASEAKRIIEQNKSKLEKIVKRLIKEETIEKEAFDELMNEIDQERETTTDKTTETNPEASGLEITPTDEILETGN